MAILCGTDLSPRSREAAEVAAALAARGDEPLYLVHALESADSDDARQALAEEAARLSTRHPRVRVDSRLERGLPDEVLAQLAAGHGPDVLGDVRLIVMASLGRRLPRWLLGSVAERTAQISPVPALVLRNPALWLAWLAGQRCLRVMVAVDFGHESDSALAWASGLARIAPCDVIALHVTAPSPLSTKRGRGSRDVAAAAEALEIRLLSDVRSRLALYDWGENQPRAWVVVASGRRAAQVARLADDEQADVVVVGSRHREAHGLSWHESVSRGVLYAASASVVCVPGMSEARTYAMAGDGIVSDVAARLEAHALIRGVPGDLVRRLATISREEVVAAGALVFRDGEEADRLYLIRYGTVVLEVAIPGKPPIRVETLGADDILGLSWLSPPHRWRFDARAVERTEMVAIDAARLREWIQGEPRLGQALALRLVAHLQRRLERVRLERLDVHGQEA